MDWNKGDDDMEKTTKEIKEMMRCLKYNLVGHI